MAMKPHLFLLLLFIASILCKPITVGAITSALEDFFNGLEKSVIKTKAFASRWAKEKVEDSKQISWEQEWRLCRQWVYYYETQKNNNQELTLATFEVFHVFLNDITPPLSFVNFCIDTINELLQQDQQ